MTSLIQLGTSELQHGVYVLAHDHKKTLYNNNTVAMNEEVMLRLAEKFEQHCETAVETLAATGILLVLAIDGTISRFQPMQSEALILAMSLSPYYQTN